MAVVVEPRPSRQDVLERAERREEMVRAALPAITADALRTAAEGGCWTNWMEVVAADAAVLADVVMAELDRRRDAELQEARDA